MAYAYKKSRHGLSLKKSRTPASAYLYAVTAKNTIVTVVVIAAVLIAVAILCAVLFNPERQTTQKTEALVADYYQNYFYEHMLDSDKFSGDAASVLQEYQASGLAPTTLEQILLLGHDTTSDASYLRAQCDTDATTIRIYPDPPYTRTSYHADIDYSCNF